MNAMRQTWLISLFVFFAGMNQCFLASAHEVFKEPLEERYNLKTVTCKTCHPKNDDRTVNNKFGQLFAEAFKGKDLTKRYEQAENQGEEAKKAFEKEMIKEFNTALNAIEKQTISYSDLIRAGLLQGTRLNEKNSKSDNDDEQSDSNGE
jgi:hypothetical protein